MKISHTIVLLFFYKTHLKKKFIIVYILSHEKTKFSLNNSFLNNWQTIFSIVRNLTEYYSTLYFWHKTRKRSPEGFLQYIRIFVKSFSRGNFKFIFA